MGSDKQGWASSWDTPNPPEPRKDNKMDFVFILIAVVGCIAVCWNLWNTIKKEDER